MIDDKSECIGVYANEKLHYDELPQSLTGTWKYSSILRDREDIVYANLLCDGKSLVQACPDHLQDRLDNILGKLKAFLTAFKEAKVSLYDNCFYDLVPQRFILEYCDIKNEITKHVISTTEKPTNYHFLLGLTKALEDIKYRKLNVDTSSISLSSERDRSFYRKINHTEPYIQYNGFKSKTGRLTTKKKSFPILTLNKNYRSILKPNNDYFVELDFNAAEVRTFIALAGISQPEGDIHQWIGKNVFNGDFERDIIKQKVFAWLYNPEAKNQKLEGLFDRNKILEKYWDGEYVETYYDRRIKADAKHALNYLIQSTTSDLFLRRMINIWNLLKGRTTYISFSIHDSLVLDFSYEERDMFNEIIDIFSETEFGKFKININVGKDFGNMKKFTPRTN